MRKAVHFGQCQLCGRQQKLPSGKLSIHGYTVQWSMFLGTCPGSKHLPYELSCEKVKEQLPIVARSMASLQTVIDGLRKPATEAKGWHHEYVPATWSNRKSSYRWVEVTIVTKPTDDGQYFRHEMVLPDGKIARGHSYHGSFIRENDPTVLATTLNNRKADTFEREMKNLRSYEKWLTERVAQWKLTELKPVPVRVMA